MIQLLPQNKTVVPNSTEPIRAVEYINSYIDSCKCENLNVDISFMNAMDACYVSAMCSSHHYIKYPEGKINWFVSSELSKELSKRFSLGNSTFNYS